jgi:DNA (cytosine-5)-methyltransferase 1
VRAFFNNDHIVADNFCGGGGASLGIEMALGRSPDVAVNHDAEAIAMHAVNHPFTKHYTESVWKIDPRKVCGKRRVALCWLSPDCSSHSNAKGGEPRDQKKRCLAWIAVTWAHRVKPDVFALENIVEWLKWGPLHREHTDATCLGRECRTHKGKKIDVADCNRCKGEGCCKRICRRNKPILAREGETFRAWKQKLESLGYVVEWRVLRACDYGAPTKRRRLFLVARRDGQPIVWPEPTHGPRQLADQPPSAAAPLKPYRTTAECVDWSRHCPSIFDRDNPLADKTLARIARGIHKFVLTAKRPFVVPVNHAGGHGRVHSIDEPMPTITAQCRGSHALVVPTIVRTAHGDVTQEGKKRGQSSHSIEEPLPTITAGGRDFALVSPVIIKAKTHGGGGNDAKSADEPLGTITTSKRGEFAVAVPYLIHKSNGERVGQAPRIYDPQEPLGTIVAQGNKHAAVLAFLAKHFGGGYTGAGSSCDEPLGAITTIDHHALVAAHVVKFQGTSDTHLTSCSSSMDEPAPSITAQGMKLAQVAAFLVRYNGTGDAEPVNEPVGALTAKPRFGLVTVTIDGEEYVIVDIGMRMLEPDELYKAQGFPPEYNIAPVVERRMANGKMKRAPLTKTAQIRMCGNSVSPPVAAAVIRANLPVRLAA